MFERRNEMKDGKYYKTKIEELIKEYTTQASKLETLERVLIKLKDI